MFHGFVFELGQVYAFLFLEYFSQHNSFNRFLGNFSLHSNIFFLAYFVVIFIRNGQLTEMLDAGKFKGRRKGCGNAPQKMKQIEKLTWLSFDPDCY